jgi:hypothetical protein
MPLIYTEDGHYLFAIDDHNDTRNGKAQWVVYQVHGDNLTPILDRHGFEATGAPHPPNPPNPDPPDPPHPNPPDPPIQPPIPGSMLLQVTNAGDGEFVNRGYSYYAQAWIAPDGTIYLFAGHRDGNTRFFAVRGDSVQRLGSKLPYRGEAEGWGWTPRGQITLTDGSRYVRADPFNGGEETLLQVDGEQDLWQAHSSLDGQVHTATVRQIRSDGAYPHVGTLIDYHGQRKYIAAQGDLDESAPSSDGEWVVIKEDNDNRVIHCRDWSEYRITNAEGAVGHSDMGDGMAYGENDQIGACVALDLTSRAQLPLYHT